MTQYTITIFSENTIGVLARITNQFTKRKINIESLDVAETEIHGISKFTVCINSDARLVETIVKQVDKQVDVFKAFSSEGAYTVSPEAGAYEDRLKKNYGNK